VSQSGTSQRLDESAGINKPNQPETKARDELTMFNVVLVAEKTVRVSNPALSFHNLTVVVFYMILVGRENSNYVSPYRDAIGYGT
jgi:hypothetical protein